MTYNVGRMAAECPVERLENRGGDLPTGANRPAGRPDSPLAQQFRSPEMGRRSGEGWAVQTGSRIRPGASRLTAPAGIPAV